MLELIANSFPEQALFAQVMFVIFLLSIAVGFCAWCVAAVTIVLIPFNAIPGAIKGGFRLNPLNVVFYTSLLTPRGLKLRKWLIGAVLTFLGAVGTGIAIGMLAQVLRG